LVALCSAPWVAFYNRRHLPVSVIVALIVLALPPLSVVTVAHPLIAVGRWFPGTRWFGLGLGVLSIVAYKRFETTMTFAVLIAASIATHARFHRPVPDPHVLAVNTNFGGQSPHGDVDSRAELQERTIEQIALVHPDTLLVFPESIIPNWNGMHEARWASVFAQLETQRTGLLIGTTIPIPNTEANRNVFLSRGYTEHLSYVQRVPVPLGMWRLGDQRSGFPLMLRFPPTIRVWNRRAGVLVCYEQLSFWPAIETLAHNPDMLLAPSNVYWATNSPIPAIQHVAAQDWADLWAIPLYEASNR
jgi:apolipoprotein N-acyltransferase